MKHVMILRDCRAEASRAVLARRALAPSESLLASLLMTWRAGFLVIFAAQPLQALLSTRPLTRRSACSLLSTTAAAVVLRPSTCWADATELAEGPATEGPGFTISLPRSYYRPQGRPRTGMDDTIFSAADLATGRTASVSRTGALDLLLASGDLLPGDLPAPTELRELGKPERVAALLARRRDGDPMGSGVARSTVTAVSREGNELRFTLTAFTTVATSATSSRPTARAVAGRAIFVPGSASGGAPYLLTAWASSAASTKCVDAECECGEGARLSCRCPPPVCELDPDAPVDPTDQAIVESLRASQAFVMQR